MSSFELKILPSQQKDSNLSAHAGRLLCPIFLDPTARSSVTRSACTPAHGKGPPPFFPVAAGSEGVLQIAEEAHSVGLGGIIVYDLVKEKREDASHSLYPDSPLLDSFRAVKAAFPDLLTVADLGVCQYTASSHCRLYTSSREPSLQESDEADERTAQHLFQRAKLYCSAGVSGLMPSAMLPSFSRRLRERLASSLSCPLPLILSQSAKFSSSLYTPFQRSERMIHVSKSAYQIAPADIPLARSLLQTELDGGADISLIKPALPYLEALLGENPGLAPEKLGAFLTSGEHQLLIELGSALGKNSFFLREAISSLLQRNFRYVVSYAALELLAEERRAS
ncbi:hypothetical protein MRY87_11890 [bacterium]|nr:hypothetical protein [bacterium]